MRIPLRYNGPAGSGNGGVTCGLLAQAVGLPVAEVTLRQPPPLDVELRLDGGHLRDGELLVATVEAGVVDVDPPPAVDVEQARAAQQRYAGLVDHPFPTCFVCGPDRPDGLDLRPGPVAEDVVACTWTPGADEPFLVWAALDCPGGWSTDLPGRPMVLGRMALEHLHPAVVGEPHVVVGQALSTSGRKTLTTVALFDADGELVARAKQTWIALPAG
ncbi:MAG: hypothetical protein JWN77_2321 [Frankiales bacterium]|nr:hypothetical protein [Frankiales bacterium]